MKIAIIVLATITILITYALCKMSSECDKYEESWYDGNFDDY